MMHAISTILALSALAAATPQAFCQSNPDERNGDALQHVTRAIIDSGDHPGNIFLLGESVCVSLPAEIEGPSQWQITDDLEQEVGRGQLGRSTNGPIQLGKLPIGWYRVGFFGSSNEEIGWTTVAVLAPLAAPTPQNSPICVDSATAWFAKNNTVEQDQLGRLAALAGVNWVRDRMRWREIQPEQDRFANDTSYDSSADNQRRYGLKILQVFHDTPRWAAVQPEATGRFPADLRHVYRFAKAMSQRFRGRVQAWEPWNEANVATFGGHTMDEICSYQKAAFLGFKAGDPHVTVCWNATTGVPTERQTDAILLNETWNYFDTYNIHTYDWADEYERLWIPARRAACGKPLWITESDRGMAFEASSPTHDFSPTNDRLKAQYVAQSYVKSLHAGAQRHFHFILGQYNEGPTQFGLLRHDMTPRPGYVALAALGRLMAGARCLGRLQQSDSSELHVYAFRSWPDGRERDVLVAWTEKNADWPDRGKSTRSWSLPEGVVAEQRFDYLGRELPAADRVTLTSAPTFMVLPKGQCDSLSLTRPETSARRDEALSAVVLQCAMPKGTTKKIERIPWAWEYDHAVQPGVPHRVPICVYNFGTQNAQGTVSIEELPRGCGMEPSQWDVDLRPMQRVELPTVLTITQEMTADADDIWITLRGNFPSAGHPVLTFRVIAEEPQKDEP